MAELSCQDMADLEAELALGLAGAQARAAATVHLDRCPVCRHRLRVLAEVADGLAGLAPPVEPPAGFESRVLAGLATAAAGEGPAGEASAAGSASRVQGEPDPPAKVPSAVEAPAAEVRAAGSASRVSGGLPRRLPAGRRGGHRLARAAVVAALALLVAGAGATGWAVGSSTSPGPAPATGSGGGAGSGGAGAGGAGAPSAAAADLVAGGRTVGTVVVAGGTEPWLSMAVESPVGSAVVRCQVVRSGGDVTTVGAFRVVDGYGYWAAPLPAGPPVRTARLLGPGGQVLATATLPHPAA